VRAPAGFTPAHCESFRQTLAQRLKGQSQKEPLVNPVLNVRMVKKQSIMHFQFGNVGDFLRIVVASPPMVATCRRLLEQGMPVMGGSQHSFETYESNWAYTLRYMVDREITGCSWATLKAGCWRQRPWTTASGMHLDKKSHCHLEMDVRFSDLVSHAPMATTWRSRRCASSHSTSSAPADQASSRMPTRTRSSRLPTSSRARAQTSRSSRTSSL